MKNPFLWEQLAHNVSLLRKTRLDETGLPQGLVADGLGIIYLKTSSSGRYYNFVNTLMLVNTSRLSWATEKTCLALEAVPGVLLQLIHFHRIVSPAEALALPISPDGFVTYQSFISWVMEVQQWPEEETDALAVPAFRLAVLTIQAPEVMENAQRVLEIVHESKEALKGGFDSPPSTSKAPLEQMRENLRGKEAIIETLQAEVESVHERIKLLQEKLESTQGPVITAPLAAPLVPPDFVLEEQRATFTASMTQEIKSLESIITEMEKAEGIAEAAPPPAPLSLARDIGLASAGRTPLPSDQENLDVLKTISSRATKLQAGLVKLVKENEELKLELQRLKESP